MSKYKHLFVNELDVPGLYKQKSVGVENMVLHSIIFTPAVKNCCWWIAEKDPNSGLCFGYVDGDFEEFAYFDLDEMTENGNEFKVHFEFKPGMTVSDAQNIFKENTIGF